MFHGASDRSFRAARFGASLVCATFFAGCVSIHQVQFTVRSVPSESEPEGAPIPGARVTVSQPGHVLKLGANSARLHQTGLSDAAGSWTVECQNDMGLIAVRADGYEESLISFGSDWEWPRQVTIYLKRR